MRRLSFKQFIRPAMRPATLCYRVQAPGLPSPPLPSTVPVYRYDGTNIDGSNNSTLSASDPLGHWENTGSGGDGTQITPAYRPLFDANSINTDKASAAFDGTADLIAMGGSVAGASFIQNTGIFEIFAVFRQDTVTANQTILGSTNSSADKGMLLRSNASRQLQMVLYNGSTFFLNLVTTSTHGLGAWSKCHIYGDGPTAYASHDMTTYYSAGIGTKSSGDSTNEIGIGGNNLPAPNNFLSGNVAMAMIFDSALSAPDRALVKAYMLEVYGV